MTCNLHSAHVSRTMLFQMFRQDSNKDLQEIGAANYAVLERIRVNRREDHLKVSSCIVSSDRKVQY